ncbi:MAG: hypothetical protein R2717_02680 [Schumannella sp.]
MIALTFRALVRTWPALLAWFLAGWAVRLVMLRIAGWVGENVDPLLGQLILPIAVLARLASYVAMFLVLRAELPHYTRLENVADRAEPGPPAGFLSSWLSTVGAAVVPFFVIYAAWGLINEDGIAYARAAVDVLNVETEGTALDTPFSWQTVSIVVVAFALRRVMARFAAKLPGWTGLVAVYLEAVWVFIAVSFIRDLLIGLPDWFATRRMFAWAVDGWASLRESIPAIDWVTEAWGWITRQLGEAVFQPLAWLALAAIVLAGTLVVPRARAGDVSPRSARPPRAGGGGRTAHPSHPDVARQRTARALGAHRERFPAGLARRSGGHGVYVLAFGVLTVGSEWLRYAVYHLLGPHELRWWIAWDEPIGLAIDVVIYLLQLCSWRPRTTGASRRSTSGSVLQKQNSLRQERPAGDVEPGVLGDALRHHEDRLPGEPAAVGEGAVGLQVAARVIVDVAARCHVPGALARGAIRGEPPHRSGTRRRVGPWRPPR